jgi:hypothetical protein
MTGTDPLVRVLRQVGDEMPPARLPADLWRRGRHRRRRKQIAALAAVVALLALALVPWPHGPVGGDRPARPQPVPVVPSTLHQPRYWQPTVQDSPPGAASMLFSGGGAGLGGIYYRSNVAVVAAGGAYRMLLGESNRQAGSDALLSPDGSRVALSFSAAHGSPLDAVISGAAVWVADLTTGQVRRYPLPGGFGRDGAAPMGWSPDGRSIAVSGITIPSPYAGDLASVDVALVDVASGTVRRVLQVDDNSMADYDEGEPSSAAFSPDGRRLAVQVGDLLSIVDTTTGVPQYAPSLSFRQRLAGPGAWSADGELLAIAAFTGCASPCDAAALDARRWTLSYLDPGSGEVRPGPSFDPVTAMTIQVLGRQAGGDAVVLTYRCSSADAPAYESDEYRPRLLALHPGGGQRSLLVPPDYVRRIDIARDAVTHDRFGGPAPVPPVLPLAHWVYRVAAVLLLGCAVLLVLIPPLVRRIRRTAPPPGPAA